MTPALNRLPTLRFITVGLITALVLMFTPLPVLAAVLLLKWL